MYGGAKVKLHTVLILVPATDEWSVSYLSGFTLLIPPIKKLTANTWKFTVHYFLEHDIWF
jgi:hypothetical protein